MSTLNSVRSLKEQLLPGGEKLAAREGPNEDTELVVVLNQLQRNKLNLQGVFGF